MPSPQRAVSSANTRGGHGLSEASELTATRYRTERDQRMMARLLFGGAATLVQGLVEHQCSCSSPSPIREREELITIPHRAARPTPPARASRRRNRRAPGASAHTAT